jgi:hypothetical protein
MEQEILGQIKAMHHILVFLYMMKQFEKENLYFLELLCPVLNFISLISLFFFSFQYLAVPLAEIIWDKDGEIINVESSFRLDYYDDGRATLYIPETFIDDQGYYTCTARNSLGSCRTTARLIIKRKLKFVFFGNENNQ